MNNPSVSDARFSKSELHSRSGSVRLPAGKVDRAWIARVVLILTFALLFATAGCDVVVFEQTEFPDALVDEDGDAVLLDDVAAIINDPALDDTAKRDALRELGIEDEDLIDVFLGG